MTRVKTVIYGMNTHHLQRLLNDGNQLLEEGRRLAVRRGQAVLVSTVCRADGADLPSLFSYKEKGFAENRFFWSEPGRKLTFAGLGCAYLIESDKASGRYQEIERRWTEIAAGSIGSEGAPEYAGPHLFGGFSFDPLNPSSSDWREYPSARFVLPRIMFTQMEDGVWITLNKIVSEHGEAPDWREEIDFLTACGSQDPSEEETADADADIIYKEETSPTDWMQAVEEAAEAIRAGEMEKVVLARSIRLYAEQDYPIAAILRRLLHEQTNSYVFAFGYGSSCFAGATPERLMRSKGREFHTLSLAGSIARGATEAEDQRLGEALYHDQKNLHEHQLTVQMIVDEMEALCEQVDVPDGPILHKLKDIQHLLTPITGWAREGATLLQAVERLHPTPALGGMPQDTAMAAIRRLEKMDRGWYAAPVGWLNRERDGEFAAAIRSALIRGREAVLFAGCGIVGDSDPRSEYEETALKFRPMLSALGYLKQEIEAECCK